MFGLVSERRYREAVRLADERERKAETYAEWNKKLINENGGLRTERDALMAKAVANKPVLPSPPLKVMTYDVFLGADAPTRIQATTMEYLWNSNRLIFKFDNQIVASFPDHVSFVVVGQEEPKRKWGTK
jgi:hypothetical protein